MKAVVAVQTSQRFVSNSNLYMVRHILGCYHVTMLTVVYGYQVSWAKLGLCKQSLPCSVRCDV